ncbi:MAG: cytochrome c, partial [Gammaproteobacteria bacterium]|nr:cytochrome c [Gammaproteobacteria bacterium]
LLKKLPPIIEGEEFDAYERMMMTKHFLNIALFDGDIEKGKKLYNRECRSCHGKEGEGDIEKGVPMLAGQYTRYLKKQVKLFIEKKRIHDIDAPDEQLLIDFTEEELNNIFAYLSSADDK